MCSRPCCLYLCLWRCRNISKKELSINQEIRDKEIRVIDEDGSQLGIMTPAVALKIAFDRDLDLVKISPAANPPVCKIMDYGKHKFEQAKRDKEAKKNQHTVDIKEVRLSNKIDVNDFNTKLNHGIRFLKAGDKLKVSIRFRGREMAHPEKGYDVMKRFAEAIAEYGNVEKEAKLEGRQMLMFIAPKPALKAAMAEEKKQAPAQPAAEDAPAQEAITSEA